MALSIQPKFPEISETTIDRLIPAGNVSKKSVHLSRWTTSLGWTAVRFPPIINPSTSLFGTHGTFHVQHGEKHLCPYQFASDLIKSINLYEVTALYCSFSIVLSSISIVLLVILYCK